jgi:CMP-N-acetylneuraminic acid synthetase
MVSLHCVIPAKGVSVGIPGKNLQHISGQSLLSITLQYSSKLPQISNIVISTDSVAVLEETCQVLGVDAPNFESINEGSLYKLQNRYWVHRREPGHASPEAKTIEFLPQILQQLKVSLNDYLLLLQPTSPFRELMEFEKLVSLADSAESVISAKVFESPHPDKRIRVDKNEFLILTETERADLSLPRQKLSKYYVIDGAFYLTKCRTVMNEHSLISEKTRIMVREGIKTINIDNEEDLEIARAVVETKRFSLNL